jgi:hypothetical protein
MDSARLLNGTMKDASAHAAGTRTISRNDSRQLSKLCLRSTVLQFLTGSFLGASTVHQPFEAWVSMIMLDGKDLRQLPLVKRKQRLARLVTGHPRLLAVEHIANDGVAMFAGALALGLEGIVAKEPKSPYVEGSRLTWH